MARHKDLEYHVGDEVFSEQEEAMSEAVTTAMSTGGKVHLDVVTHSEAAARAFGGDCAVEDYREDPDASVHERLIVTAESIGRVP